MGYESTSFAKCIPTANISEHNSRKGYKTLGNVFFNFPQVMLADSRLGALQQNQTFLLSNDSVPPQYMTNSEKKHVLTLGTEAHM